MTPERLQKIRALLDAPKRTDPYYSEPTVTEMALHAAVTDLLSHVDALEKRLALIGVDCAASPLKVVGPGRTFRGLPEEFYRNPGIGVLDETPCLGRPMEERRD